MTSISNFLETNPTAEQIYDKVEELKTELADNATRKSALEKERDRVFIECDDEEISAFQASFAEFEAKREKLSIQVHALEKRMGEVHLHEKRSKIENLLEDARTASRGGIKLMDRYFTLAEEIAEIAKALDKINQQVAHANQGRANSEVHKKGELEKVLRPDLLAREELIKSGHPAQDFLGILKLPGRSKIPIWDAPTSI